MRQRCLKPYTLNQQTRLKQFYSDNFLELTGATAYSFQHLMNPTFYPKEALMLGVDLWIQLECSLYMCRWQGVRLDTVEDLAFRFMDKGSVVYQLAYCQ